MSEPQEPRPSWWVPSPEGGPPPAPSDRPLPPPPSWPAPPPAQPYSQPYPPYAQPYIQPYGPGFATPTTNGLAVASFVCGLVGLLGWLACFVAAFAAFPGLVLGIVGLYRIGKSEGREKGRGLAIAGIVTSGVAIAVSVMLLVVLGISLGTGNLD
jgi:hypothetical protein